MERCPICGERKVDGSTIYSVDLGTGVVVVRGVPAKICSQCGEEWICADVAKKLEEIVNLAKEKHLELEVVSFKN